ncbi:sodium-dependent transporter bedraggled [Ischnura elegans]|uniref:sodium-dependent transporter bedraggled n=1 Tax=Ischnura elegans TaxID=197161 RepID=UPI001ED8B315|nr:sodium-dependent transporter bedraggled [Ischnura elegans]
MPLDRADPRRGSKGQFHPEPGDLIDLRTPQPKRPGRRRPEDHFPEARTRWSTRGTRDSRGQYARSLARAQTIDQESAEVGGGPATMGVWATESSRGGQDEGRTSDWQMRGNDPTVYGDYHDDEGREGDFKRSASARGWLEGAGRAMAPWDPVPVRRWPKFFGPRAGGAAVSPRGGSGADVVLIPEIPTGECAPVCDSLREEDGDVTSDVILPMEVLGEPQEEVVAADERIAEEPSYKEENLEVESRRRQSSSNSASDLDDQPDWSWIAEVDAASGDAVQSQIPPRADLPPSAPPAALLYGEDEEVEVVEWEGGRRSLRRSRRGSRRRHASTSPPRRMQSASQASSAATTLPCRRDHVGNVGTTTMGSAMTPTPEAAGLEGRDPEPSPALTGALESQLRLSRSSMRRLQPLRISARRMVHSAPEAPDDSPSNGRGDLECGLDAEDPEGLSGRLDAAGDPEEEDDEEEEDEAGDGNGTRMSSGSDEGSSSAIGPGMNQSPLGPWPHSLSSMFACLGCTVGLFNISRFAILSIHFGANFIVQFIILSLIFGIPLYAFHVSIGQYLGAGVIDMWKISPVFQGIGVALLISQALLGIYSIIGVSWMFVYFRDSFITKQDVYRWAEPFDLYREGGPAVHNGTFKLEETVPDYFSGVVLQRHNLPTAESSFGHLKFQLVFNLAVVWMIIFVCLCKGLKSYGKVVYVFAPLSILCLSVVCTKMLGIVPFGDPGRIFHETVWNEFFLNSKSWLAAATEAFFTWGLLGASAMQIASHNAGIGVDPGCKKKSKLHRDTIVVVCLTLTILILSAFLGNTCVRLLHVRGGYHYMPSSFEKISTYPFLRPMEPVHFHGDDSSSVPPLLTTPARYMTHVPLVAGVQVAVPWPPMTVEGSYSKEIEFLRDMVNTERSGYQSLRIATELAPAAFAFLGTTQLSPFWAVLFYFTLILFGIGQQLAIWHCVITGITAINTKKLKTWETTITFFACAFGFVLGLPMTTELGIFAEHFLDYCLGCGWWMMAIYLTELGSVLVIRGRPYGGENVVTALFPSLRHFQHNTSIEQRRARNQQNPTCLATWAAPTLAFAWNVMLPVALMVLAITAFKNGNFQCLYNWSKVNNSGARGFEDPFIFLRGEDFEHTVNHSYWPIWARQVGSFLQLIPLLCIPIIAFVQTVRYLSSGSPDLFERIQALYCPSPRITHCRYMDNSQAASTQRVGNSERTTGGSSRTEGNSNGNASEGGVNNFEDPPPKYTPPPSYTTATGARIAKMLRQSFRRSMRRLTTVLGEAGSSQMSTAEVVVSRQEESTEGNNGSVTRGGRSHNRLSLPPITSCASNEPETDNSASPLPPPDYASVLIEIRQSLQQGLSQGNCRSADQPNATSEDFTELQRASAVRKVNGAVVVGGQTRVSTITAERVATLLRSSGRRPNHSQSKTLSETAAPPCPSTSTSASHQSPWRSSFRNPSSLSGPNSVNSIRPSESVECLVDGEVPIHEECSNSGAGGRGNDGEVNLGLEAQCTSAM